MEWKPIRTAPKAKSEPFLAYAPANPKSKWGNHFKPRYAVCYYSFTNTLCELVTEFMFDADTRGDQTEFKPTHWMPLPSPPSK